MDLQDIDLKQLIENETGEKFNNKGYLKCPFHNEKTPSLKVKFFSDKNKQQFHCFGCNEHGDAIDFISKFKGLDYIKSKEYLGLQIEKTEKELLEEKVQKYIDWELNNFRYGQKLLGIFKFTDKNNDIAYFKAKFKLADNKKQLSYYHIENDKVITKRGGDELPYNLCKTLEAIKNNDVIIIVEGEKDANTINSIFKNKGYVATSIKGCKYIEMLQKKGLKIYFIGDTGQAGEQYKWDVWNFFKYYAKEFRFVNLPGLKSLGDNKDVTDWIECGHDRKNLLAAFDRSLDIKNKYELQQDLKGIYKTIFKEKNDEIIETRKYLTDFKVLEATRINFVNEEAEGVKLVLKSPTGQTIERIGPSIVFDDTRTFKNFLGTLDLGFKGKVDDLTDLKSWINKYFALENEEVHAGVQFKIKNNQPLLITSNGALTKDRIYKNIKSDERNNINITELEALTKEELKEIKKHIFRFSGPDKSISIIGTIINNLAIAQCNELKIKLHHLLIIGEAGSGKSTILENVIATILNYPSNQIKSLGLATNFSLIKDLSDGNYSMIYEEHKPSRWDRYKISKVSEILRNLYDGSTVARGDKSLKSKNFYLGRPVIIAGEESYYNNEKALIDRSCIIYTSKNERTKENSDAMKWIIENETLLNRLGKDLIKVILELSVEDYKKIRSKVNFNGLNDRVLNTAVNIAVGMEILNILLRKKGLKTITNYMQYIEQNIKTEVLDEGNEAHSVVEQMIVLYNNMIEDSRAFQSEDVVRYRGDGIFIKTSEMLNQINEHIKRVNADIIPLGLKDFRKQAKKSGYLLGTSNKLIKVGLNPVRFDTYSAEKLRELKVNSIIPPELEEVTDNVIPFK